LNFAIAARDELWAGGRRIESRLMHGIARQNGNEIVATDDADPALLAACDDAMARARELGRVENPSHIHIRVRATAEGVETTFVITIDGVSVVSTPEHVVEDTNLLRRALSTPALQHPSTLVWRHGSAAVLLHEAIGHANEHGAPPVEWPSWLRVDAPLAMRRESFSDVPLLRMTHLRAWQEDAPFAMPKEHVDVHLVAGGSYDPLTDVVTLQVAVPRFTIRATRAAIARALRGASGGPLRYPGVICSREGQELHVPSFAPLMVTDPL
jgi:hypothetical protein